MFIWHGFNGCSKFWISLFFFFSFFSPFLLLALCLSLFPPIEYKSLERMGSRKETRDRRGRVRRQRKWKHASKHDRLQRERELRLELFRSTRHTHTHEREQRTNRPYWLNPRDPRDCIQLRVFGQLCFPKTIDSFHCSNNQSWTSPTRKFRVEPTPTNS